MAFSFFHARIYDFSPRATTITIRETIGARFQKRKRGLHEGGLQPDLEGGDRTRLIGEGCFEMSERKLRRLLGINLRRLAQAA